MRKFSLPTIYFLYLGVLGVFSQILLIFGIFERTYLLLFLLLGVLYSIYTYKNKLNDNEIIQKIKYCGIKIKENWKSINFLLIVIILFITSIYTWLNFIPIIHGDAISYHMPFVADFINTGHLNYPIAGITEKGNGYFPALAEIMFASIILIINIQDIYIPMAIFQSLVLIFLLYFIYDFLKIYIDRKSIRLMTILWILLMPDIVLMILRVGMIELLVYSFIILGLLNFIKGLNTREKKYFYTASFFIAISLSMKYAGLIALFYLSLLFILYYIRKYISLKVMLISALIIFSFSSYWYIHNLISFDNPIYPIFSNEELNKAIALEVPPPQSLIRKIFYPVVIYAPFLFRDTASKFIIVELLTCLTAIAGSAFLLYKKMISKKTLYIILGFSLTYSWISAFVADDIRYNLPALICLIIVSCIVIENIINYFPKIREKNILAVMLLYFVMAFPLLLNQYKDRLPLLTGKVSKESYIVMTLGNSYTMEQYKNAMEFMRKD